MLNILFIFLYIATPIAILWLCKHVRAVQKIGEVLLAYFAGVVMAIAIWLCNLSGAMDADTLASLRKLQSTVCDLVIPFAIPLMLFSANLKSIRSQLGKATRAMFAGLAAVVLMTFSGALLFREHVPDIWKIAGLVTGVEIGGTPNMAAIQVGLNLNQNTYLQLQMSDMIVCFFYLLFLFSGGKTLFRKFMLPYTGIRVGGDTSSHVEGAYYFLRTPNETLQVIKSLAVSIVVVGLSVGAILLFFNGRIADNMLFLMLFITTLSIAASFIGAVRRLRYSFDAGMFLVLIFNVTIASMVDLDQLFNVDIYYIAGYVGYCVFGSLLLHALLCKLLRVDADTFMVCSTAFINSPPFVPVTAAAIGNRHVILVGITVGIIGYAFGNYLGFTVAAVLKAMGM